MADSSSSSGDSFDDYLNSDSNGNPLSSVDQSSKSAPTFSAPTPYQLNPADAYNQALQYSGAAAQQSSDQSLSNLRQTNELARQANNNSLIAKAQFGGGSANPGSGSGGGNNGVSANTNYYNSSSQSGGNALPTYVTNMQTAQNNLDNQQSLNSSNRYNQSLLMGQQYQGQSNLQSEQDKSNENIANIQAGAAENVAATQAQGNILSNLFNSVGGQKFSPQYW